MRTRSSSYTRRRSSTEYPRHFSATAQCSLRGPKRGFTSGPGVRRSSTTMTTSCDDRFVGTGRVTFLGGSEYHTDGDSHWATSLVSGETVRVEARHRVVDATYLSPTIPATSPPPFRVADGARVVPVNELGSLTEISQAFRRRRLREDRDRRNRLAADTGRSVRTDHVGAAPGTLDAQSSRRSAGSRDRAGAGCGHHGRGSRGGIDRRHVPAPRSRRGHAPDRHRCSAQHGQDAHSRASGSST